MGEEKKGMKPGLHGSLAAHDYKTIPACKARAV